MTGQPPIADKLLPWFDAHGRHDLPWQHPRDPYRVWVAEIMLQQTQVATVIDYFNRFMAALPTLPDLAAANEDRVLALWSGLGYYQRARRLHQAARECVDKHDGALPGDFDALVALPGIGRSTAGAILAQSHGWRFPILDGNAKRVLVRYFGIDADPTKAATLKSLWQHADAETPATRVADYTQAIMDLGATICTRHNAHCNQCPLADHCQALKTGMVDALPRRRPTKKLPERDTIMLVLIDQQGQVLLEKRPEQGVWAGLWSLPEATEDTLRRTINRHGKATSQERLASFTHVFSHYRLNITPVVARIDAIPQVADTATTRWCDKPELATLGLPAPVRKLIDSLIGQPDQAPRAS